MVAAERIVAVISPDSAPAKRLVQDSKENRRTIDCTGGHKTASIIITDSEHIILSAVSAETLAARFSGGSDSENDDIQ